LRACTLQWSPFAADDEDVVRVALDGAPVVVVDPSLDEQPYEALDARQLAERGMERLVNAPATITRRVTADE